MSVVIYIPEFLYHNSRLSPRRALKKSFKTFGLIRQPINTMLLNPLTCHQLNKNSLPTGRLIRHAHFLKIFKSLGWVLTNQWCMKFEDIHCFPSKRNKLSFCRNFGYSFISISSITDNRIKVVERMSICEIPRCFKPKTQFKLIASFNFI